MFSSLSDIQKEIVFNKSGRFVVRACPGSGKTYCVGARLARLIQGWKKQTEGIAVLSFTNVAWQEIEKKCSEQFCIKKIQYPHFIGTIDSFVNQYIFLPFGHLVLGSNSRPTLVGEPHGTWSGGNYDRDPNQHFTICSFDINGNLIPTVDKQLFGFKWDNNKDGSENKNVTNLRNSKWSLLKKGYATQADANYFAMKIIEKYPNIAKSIVCRFPTFIIDEAQDTSDVQMKIIDLLIENGLNEIMLVGDPDQAIFEWNDAKPELLNQKYTDWTNSIILNENRRSSQNICNFTHKISSFDTPSTAVSEVKDFSHVPKIVVYNENNINQAITEFITECKSHNIIVSQETTAVISRSQGLVNKILDIPETRTQTSPWTDKHTKDFAKGKFLYDNGKFKDGFRIILKTILKICNKLSYCSERDIDQAISEKGFIETQSFVYSFIHTLPNTINTSIGQWINTANNNLTNKNHKLQLAVHKDCTIYTFPQLFSNEDKQIYNKDFRYGTVHSVKGETFEAVLLILKTKSIGKAYKTILNDNTPISDSEELRIVYVGLTRPRKILWLAVPNDENKIAWENKTSN